jgi:hypothetical protein
MQQIGSRRGIGRVQFFKLLWEIEGARWIESCRVEWWAHKCFCVCVDFISCVRSLSSRNHPWPLVSQLKEEVATKQRGATLNQSEQQNIF